jgi:N-acetyl-anhydromuramyl-L-alanine amidase AmpD
MMNGSAIVAMLPEQAGEQREQRILELMELGMYVPPTFTPLLVSNEAHYGAIYVAQDALQLGKPEDRFRVNVTARTAQWICDDKSWILPTTSICDLIWRSALIKLTPCIQPADPRQRANELYSPAMDDTLAMLRHSQEVDAKRAGRCGLIAPIGKNWVLSNALTKSTTQAANYGWYDPSAPHISASGIRMWQTLGTTHGVHHTDYSQVLRPIRREMMLDGRMVDMWDVLSNHELASLLSTEGALKVLRIPAAGVSPSDAADEVEPAVWEPGLPPTARLSCAVTLRRGSRGEAVKLWQRFIRVAADGVFGPLTEAATRAWQAARPPLQADGIVGPKTVAAANRIQELREAAGGSASVELIETFVQAKNYTPKPEGRQIKWLVVHTAEMQESPTGAEALGAWAAGSQAPRASWHYAVDSDSIVQCVLDQDVAWHAPGGNNEGIGVELVGRARQSVSEWEDDFSVAQLGLAARLFGWLAKKHNIPLVFVDAEGLQQGVAGVTTHHQISLAFKKSDHWDPGPNFPMQRFLLDAQRARDVLG